MDKLKQMSIWLMWRYEMIKGELKKVPYSAKTLHKCGVDEKYRNQLVPFDEASGTAKAKGFEGIGFVIPEGYGVIDLDDATDEYINEIHSLVPSYMEISPRGKGRHIIFMVDAETIPQKDGKVAPEYYVKNPNNKTELYIGGLTNRYMTYTGEAVFNTGIADCTEGVLEFMSGYMRKNTGARKQAERPVAEPVDEEVAELNDLDIIKTARRAKNAEKFNKLYDKGDISDYGSHSEADMALCNYLAFYSQGDEYAIDRLFRKSALYRDKWDRDDYRESTIQKAIDQCGGKFYTGQAPMPPFVYEDSKGRRTVSCPRLAKYFRENQYLLSVRDTGRGGVQRFLYEDGCYRPYADEMLKGVIKKYITDYDESLLHMRDVNEVFQQLITDLNFVRTDELNDDENIINFTNGLLDLRTFKMLPHDPRILSTIQLPCEWKGVPDKTPVFDGFINTLTGGDKEVQKLLLEFIGAIFSNIHGGRLKKALFMVGPGDSGKSVLKSLVERILGKGNYAAIDLQELEARFGTANIYGKRLAGSSDMSFMTVGELKAFKQCTGGDFVFAEYKGQNGFEFRYQGLLWFCMNRLPKFGGDDGDWVYDRIIQISCNNAIPLSKQDKFLIDKLYAEREGIVYKAVKAFKGVMDNGCIFSEPVSVRDARKQYQSENNTVIAFFKECMVKRDKVKIMDCATTGTVYKVYREWCKDNNHGFAKTAKEFRDDLSKHLGTSYSDMVIRRGTGGSFYKDYTLTQDAKDGYRKVYGYCADEEFLGA